MTENPYRKFFDDKQREDQERLRQSVEAGSLMIRQEPPERTGRHLDAVTRSQATGQPHEASVLSLDYAEPIDVWHKPYLRAMPKIAPTLTDRLLNRGQAPALVRDLDPLVDTESRLRRFMRQPGIGLREGVLTDAKGVLEHRAMMGTITEKERGDLAQIDYYLQGLQADQDDATRLDWFARTGFSALGQVAAQYAKIDPTELAAMTTFGAGAGYLLGGGPVSGPVSGITALTGAGAGAGAALLKHSLVHSYEVISGLAYLEISQIKDEDGNPIDPERARQLAKIVGVLGTIPETGGEIFSFIGVDKWIPSAAISNFFTRIVKSPKLSRYFVKAATNRIAQGMAIEGAEEATQSLIQDLVVAADIGLFEENFEQQKSIDEIWTTALENAKAGAVGGAFFGAGGQMFSTANNHIRNRAKAAAKILDTKAYNEKPRVIADLINEVMEEEAEQQEVWVEAGELQALFQADGRDQAWIEENLPDVAEQLGEAEATGTQVGINAGDFMTYIETSANYEQLKSKVMTQPQDTRLVRELKTLVEEQQANLPEERKTEWDRIQQSYQKRFAAAGAQPARAEALGEAFAAFFAAQAEDSPLTAAQLAERYQVRVEHNVAPIDNPQRMEQLIDLIQKGEIVTEREVAGPTLKEFLADKQTMPAEEQLRHAQMLGYVGDLDLNEWEQVKANAGVVTSPRMASARKARQATEMAHLQRMADDIGIDLTVGSPADVVNLFRQAAVVNVDTEGAKGYDKTPPGPAGLKNVEDAVASGEAPAASRTGPSTGGVLFQPVKIESVQEIDDTHRIASGVVNRAYGAGKPTDIPFYKRDFSKFGSRTHDAAAWQAHTEMVNSVPLAERNEAFDLRKGGNKLQGVGIYELSRGCFRNGAVLSAAEAGYISADVRQDLTSCHGSCYKNFDQGAQTGGNIFNKMLVAARREKTKGKPLARQLAAFLSEQLDMKVTQGAFKKPAKGNYSPTWMKMRKRYEALSLDAKRGVWEALREQLPQYHSQWLPQEAQAVRVATAAHIRRRIESMGKSTFMKWINSDGKFFRGNQQGDWLNELTPDADGNTPWETFIEAVLTRWEKETGKKRKDFPKRFSVVTGGWYADVPREILTRIADKYGDHLLVQVTGPIDYTGAEVDFRLAGYAKLHDAGLMPVMRMITDEYGIGGGFLNDPEAIRKTIEFITYNKLIPSQILETPLHFDSARLANARLSDEHQQQIQQLVDGGMDRDAATQKVVGKKVRNMAVGIQELWDIPMEEAERQGIRALERNTQYYKKASDIKIGPAEVGLTHGRLREMGVPAEQLEELKRLGFFYKLRRTDGPQVEGVFPNRCCTTAKCLTCKGQCSAEYLAAIESGELEKASQYVGKMQATEAADALREGLTHLGHVRLMDPRKKTVYQSVMTAPIWRTVVPDVLNAKLPAKGSSQSFIDAINAYVRKGMIKAEEVEASGLIEALEQWEGKVTKDDVMEYLAANEARLEEVTRGEGVVDAEIEDAARSAFYEDFGEDDKTFQNDMQPYLIDVVDKAWKDPDDYLWKNAPSTKEQYYEQAEGDEDAALELFSDDVIERMVWEDIFDDAEYDRIQEEVYQTNRHEYLRQARIDLDRDVVYEQHQMDGVQDKYRELLLTVPKQEPQVDYWEVARPEDGREIARYDTHAEALAHLATSRTSVDIIPRRVEGNVIKHVDIDEKTFKSAHWEEENVLAHIRFNERTDADGNRILMIEEIQSDWHQEGRKKGYVNPKHKEIERKALAGETLTDEEMRIYNEEMNASPISGDIPDVPWKKSWPLLAMKRMVRYAAEHGYDQIAWTPGEVQTARYDLSKRVDFLEAGKNDNETWDLLFDLKDGQRIERIGLSEKEVEEHVGKELAEKIINEQGEHTPRGFHLRRYRDADLKIGGEGMKGFYDQILPAMVKKFFGKAAWGKPKLGTTEVVTTRGMGEEITTELLAKAAAMADNEGADRSAKFLADQIMAMERGEEYSFAIHNTNLTWPGDRGPAYYVNAVRQYKDVTQTVHSLQITEKMKERALTEGMPLFQEGGIGYKGYMTTDDMNTAFKITLTKQGDLTTFLHESGHVFLRIQENMVAHGLLSPEATDRYNAMLEHIGAKPGEELSAQAQERFVGYFEQYLATGKAPTPKLQQLFREFKMWLISIYQRLRGKHRLPEDVRLYMDHLFAAQSAIVAAGDERVGPIFRDHTEMNGTPEEYVEYVQAYRDAENEAEEDLLKSITKDNAGLDHQRFKQALAEARLEAKEQLAKNKAQVANHFLRTGKMLDGSEVPAEMAGAKLNAKELRRLFPADIDKPMLKRVSHITRAQGMDPDEVAQFLGYDMTTDLLHEIQYLGNFSQERTKYVRNKLKEQFSPMTLGQLHDRAYEIMEGPAMQRFRRMEEDILDRLHRSTGAATRATRMTRDKITILREFAKDKIAQTPHRKLRPHKYRTAENKAVKELTAAIARKDYTAAAVAKKKVVLNQFMHREALQAKNQGEAIRKYARRFVTDRALQKKILTGGRNFLDAIHAVMERVDLKNVTAQEAEFRKTLNAYVKKIESGEMGQEVNLPEWLLEEGGTLNWRDLSMERLRGIERSIKHLEHLAKEYGSVRLAEERQDLTTTNLTLASQMQANNKMVRPTSDQNPRQWEKMRNAIRRTAAFMTKVEQLVLWIDGGEPGLAHKMIFRPIAEAQHQFNDLMVQYRQTLMDPLSEYMQKHSKRLGQDVKFFRQEVDHMGRPVQVDHYLKVHELISMALNMGTLSNRQKMLGGYGWTEAQVMDLLDNHLTREDWEMVEHIWKEVDTLWPLISKVQREVNGITPPKIGGVMVNTKHGLFGDPQGRYGYYPVIYDPMRSHLAERYEQQANFIQGAQNNIIMPVVAHGFMEERTRYTGPVLLDLAVLPRHINDTLHFFTHAQAVNNVNRLTRMGIFRKAATETFGREYYNLINPWLLRVANQGRVDQNANEMGWLARHMKSSQSILAMGMRPWTAMMQTLGLFTTAHRIGAKYTFRGVRRLFDRNEYNRMYSFARDNSGEMRHLDQNYDRELRETLMWARDAAGLWKYHAKVANAAFYGLQQVQRSVSTATFHGAYERHIERHPTCTHEDAIAAAESYMRMTQSSGAIKDLAKVQTWGPFFQMFNLFYTYSNLVFNIINTDFRDVTRMLNQGQLLKASSRMIGHWWYMMLLPSLIPTLVRRASMGPPEDEEDDITALDLMLWDPMKENLRVMPVFGNALVSGLEGYRYRSTPLQTYVDLGRRLPGVYERWRESEDTDADWRATWDFVGLTFKVPSKQAYDWYRYMYLLTNDELANPYTGWFTRPVEE